MVDRVLRWLSAVLLIALTVDWAFKGEWGYVALDAVFSLVILRGLLEPATREGDGG